MTYNYFNAGRLAFGKKITAAFNSLNELFNSAQEHVGTISEQVSYYAQFLNKNYAAPSPTNPTMPVRTDEIFDICENAVFIKNISRADGVNLTVEVTYYNNDFSRITVGSGTTTMAEGYAILKQSTDLNDFAKDIRFSNTNDVSLSEVTLFKFTCEGTVVLIEPVDIQVDIMSQAGYKSLSISRVGTGSYTCTDRVECIVAQVEDENTGSRSYGGPFDMKLNGQTVFAFGSGQYSMPSIIFYLKKGDTISGTHIGKIYRVYYNL